MRRVRRPAHDRLFGTALLLASAVLAHAPAAHANGRLPTIVSIEARDDAPDTILLGATFGLVFTVDGGATWEWVCEMALGYMGIYDPIFVNGGSSWMATLFDGLARSDDGGCTWTTPGGTDGIGSWRSLVAHPGIAGTYYAATGGDSGSFALYVSTDDGLTFAPTTLTSPAQYYDGIAASPVDPLRLYVGSWYPMPRQGFVNRSDDGGVIWTTTEQSTTNLIRLRVLGTSATDPDVVFWLEDGMTDAIWRSDDGGLTGTVSWDGEGAPFSAFAIGPDGTLHAANLAGQIVTSIDDGLTWIDASVTSVTCLDEGANTLYGCTNTFSTGFAASASSDQGQSFEGLYAFEDTDGPVSYCAAGTPTRDLCDPAWPALRVALGIDPSPDGGEGTDAGVDAGSGGPCGGRCSVTLVGARARDTGTAAGSFLVALAIAALAIVRLRRSSP